MPTVQINKTAYVKIVDAAAESFTAQCRAETSGKSRSPKPNLPSRPRAALGPARLSTA